MQPIRRNDDVKEEKVKIVISLLLICLLTAGCSTGTYKYFRNPESRGYHQKVFGGVCPLCGDEFKFSKYQLDTYEEINCPYCDQKINLQEAANRYGGAVFIGGK